MTAPPAAAAPIAGARFVASPNFDERPPGESIRLIVVHAISLPPGEFGGDSIERLFTNSLDATAHPFFADIVGLRVSAHFLIRRNGSVTQFVPCDKRAWHAGASRWRGREHCNDFSIGIELEGGDEVPFEEDQYQALVRLVIALRGNYPIEEIVGHCDIAPGRKTDPGPHFDWQRLSEGLSDFVDR